MLKLFWGRPLKYTEGPTYQHVSPAGLPGCVITIPFIVFGAAFYQEWSILIVVAGVIFGIGRLIYLNHAKPKRILNLEPESLPPDPAPPSMPPPPSL